MNGIKAAFVGRVGGSIEMRQTKAGKAWLKTSAVVQDDRGDKDHPQWISVSYFADDAEIIHATLQKGSEVYVEGTLRLNTWTDQEEGNERTGLSISSWRLIVMGAIGWKNKKKENNHYRGNNRRERGNGEPPPHSDNDHRWDDEGLF